MNLLRTKFRSTGFEEKDKNQNAHFADGRLLIHVLKNGNEKVPKMAKRLLISVDNDAHGPGTSFCHIYFFLFLKEALFFLIFCSHLFPFLHKNFERDLHWIKYFTMICQNPQNGHFDFYRILWGFCQIKSSFLNILSNFLEISIWNMILYGILLLNYYLCLWIEDVTFLLNFKVWNFDVSMCAFNYT